MAWLVNSADMFFVYTGPLFADASVGVHSHSQLQPI